MDSTVPAVVVAAALAGLGGLFVPTLIGRIPEVEPEPGRPGEAATGPDQARPGSEADATVDAAPTEDPPEPFADIARLPGLGWRSAVVAALAGAVVGLGLGWTWALVLWVPLVPVSVALAVVDWRTRLLPTAVIRPTYAVLGVLVLVGWAVTGDTDAALRAALGWLVGGGLYAILWFIYPRGLGFGDVRLAGVLGIALGWLGWGPLLVGVYAGFLLGGVIGGLLSVLRIVERKGFPFGPFMLLGALTGLLWAPTCGRVSSRPSGSPARIRRGVERQASKLAAAVPPRLRRVVERLASKLAAPLAAAVPPRLRRVGTSSLAVGD